MNTKRKIKVGDWVITNISLEMDVEIPDFLVLSPPRKVIEISFPGKGISRNAYTFTAHCPHEDEDDFASDGNLIISRSDLIGVFDNFDSALACYKVAKEKTDQARAAISKLKQGMVESVQAAITQANGTSTIDADGEYINDE